MKPLKGPRKPCPECKMLLRPGQRHPPAYCQYRKATGPKLKYKNKPQDLLCDDGEIRSFPSGLERSTYQTLRLREKAGDISDLECQVSIRIGPNRRRWILDFKFNQEGSPRFADAKGLEHDRWKHLLDLWADYGPCPLEVWKDSGSGEPVLVETIVPNRKEIE